jgi:hypothetical protein
MDGLPVLLEEEGTDQTVKWAGIVKLDRPHRTPSGATVPNAVRAKGKPISTPTLWGNSAPVARLRQGRVTPEMLPSGRSRGFSRNAGSVDPGFRELLEQGRASLRQPRGRLRRSPTRSLVHLRGCECLARLCRSVRKPKRLSRRPSALALRGPCERPAARQAPGGSDGLQGVAPKPASRSACQ